MAVSAGTSMFGLMEIGVDAGEFIVVIGPGPIGLTSLALVKALGAGTTVMVGTRWSRLNLAKELGADVLVNIREGQDPVKVVLELTDGLGADLVINTTPSPESVAQSVKMLRRGGRLLMLGITWEPTPLVLGEIVVKGITIKGTRGEARNALDRVISLASSGKIDLKKIITNVFPLSEVIHAFEVFEKRIGDPVKVVVKP
jgi:L-iditol 2-dehydrogenase